MSDPVGLQGACGIVVVHFGDPAPTQACVASVLADHSTVGRTVVVVDNSGSFPAVGPASAVKVVTPIANLGFGGGVNAGVAALAAGGHGFIVFLNHDVEVVSGFLAAARAALALPGVGAAAGPLFLDRPDGPLWYAGGGVRFLTGTVWQSRRDRDAGRARDVGFLPGAAVAVRADSWRDVGGFDPSYFLYNEDVDLCLRLRRRGWRLRFEPGMRAVHHLGAATGSKARSPLYLEHSSRTRLRPFRPLALRLHLAVVHTAYVAVRAGWFAAAGNRAAARALLRGHRDALATIDQGPR